MSEITLEYPLVIAPTLDPAVKLGDKFITLDIGTGGFNIPGIGKVSDIRAARVRMTDSEYVRHMFAALMGFLGAFAESLPDGENADLFPAPFAEWAIDNSDDIEMLSYELENEE